MQDKAIHSKKIEDRVSHSKKIDWKSIQTLQPDGFKVPEQQEVLKKSLLANGFVSPFCVWQDEAGVIWSIDGVHRIKALTELQKQGQDIPELLTANFIDAENKKEAGEILITVFNSKQNKATEQGVIDLKLNLGIDDLCLDFEELDIKIELDSVATNNDDLFATDNFTPEQSNNPTKTSEGYVEFSIVLSQENKNIVIKKINDIKQSHPQLSQEEVFMALIN